MTKALVSGLLISAAMIATALALPASILAPFNAARAADQPGIGVAAGRIDQAFASLSEVVVDAALAAAAAPAPKGDFAPACANALWPHIDAACLTTADGRPARHVRTITIGYLEGANTTVLVRIPVAEMAQR